MWSPKVQERDLELELTQAVRLPTATPARAATSRAACATFAARPESARLTNRITALRPSRTALQAATLAGPPAPHTPTPRPGGGKKQKRGKTGERCYWGFCAKKSNGAGVMFLSSSVPAKPYPPRAHLELQGAIFATLVDFCEYIVQLMIFLSFVSISNRTISDFQRFRYEYQKRLLWLLHQA